MFFTSHLHLHLPFYYCQLQINTKLFLFTIFLAEIINISSDSSEANSCDPPSFAFSSDSCQSNGWSDYFPKEPNPFKLTSKEPNPFKLTSKRVESTTTVIDKKEAKLAFDARKKVLGLPAPATWKDRGIKAWVPKGKKY